MSRKVRIMLGTLLIIVGLAGTLALGPATPVTAQTESAPAEAHETMEVTMDAMHGAGTAERMHRVPGAEEMMDQCAAMMAAMGGGMMGDGMMGDGMTGNGMMRG